MVAVARQKLSATDAEDVTQELLTYWSAARVMIAFPDDARAFVTAAVARRAVSRLRRAHVRARRGPDPDDLAPPAAVQPDVRLDIIAILLDDDVPADVRAATLLRAAGHSWKEIAGALGQPNENTLQVRVDRFWSDRRRSSR